MSDALAPSIDVFAEYPRVPRPVKKVVMYPKIQPDTVTGLYLIQSFGEALFPGIREATYEFWPAVPPEQDPRALEAQGYLFLDIGKGMFDHHAANAKLGKRVECMTTLVAQYLHLESHPALRKIIAWTRRSDLEGKGTISSDPLDKAFSLENLLMLLNREYNTQPERVLRIALELIAVHIRSEFRKAVEMPAEWERMQKEGKILSFTAYQGSAELLGVAVHSDNLAFPSFIRTVKKKDIVVQRRTTGHASVITKQIRSIDLRPAIAALRVAEAKKKGMTLPTSVEELQKPGRLLGLEEWYYDDAANTLQNGGAYTQGTMPTRLSNEEIVAILEESLPLGRIGWLKRSRARDLGPNGTAEVIEE